jgi:hypothetical protein
MKVRELNGKTRYFNLSIHKDMLKSCRIKAIDEDISTSHFICNCIQDKIGD